MGFLTTERDRTNARILRMLIGVVGAVALFWFSLVATGQVQHFLLGSGVVFSVIGLLNMLLLMGRRKS